MGVLTTARQLLLLAVIAATCCCSCAAVAPPHPSPPHRLAFQCGPVQGTPRGLLIEVTIREPLPEGAVIALFRDGNQLLAFEAAQMGPPPQTVLVGDPNLDTAEEVLYQCGVWMVAELLASRRSSLVGVSAPDRPPSPVLAHDAGGVRVSWTMPEGVLVAVMRRNIVEGGDPSPVSPLLQSGDWLDLDTELGEVYAYSLHPAVRVGDIAWYGDAGLEAYIEGQ